MGGRGERADIEAGGRIARGHGADKQTVVVLAEALGSKSWVQGTRERKRSVAQPPVLRASRGSFLDAVWLRAFGSPGAWDERCFTLSGHISSVRPVWM